MKNFIKMIRGSALVGAALMAIAACTVEAPPAGDGDGDGGDGDGDVTGSGGAGACPAGALMCGGTCTNTMSDPLNCGQCGTGCGALLCSAGVCSDTCGAGLTECTGACANLQTDFQNCGACGTVCASGVCTAGVCQVVQTGTGGAGPGTGGAGPGTGGDGPGTGGSGPGTGGVINNDGDPPGFWRYGPLQGCAWTGIDATSSGTTIAPQDFTTRAPEEAYCAAGSVGANADYESVALLGFNVGEDPATADCSYDPGAAQAVGPPGVTLTGDGIAANIVKQGGDTAFTFRVQIQGPNGATDENDRWCATITETQGKIFVPWADFNTQCWDGLGTAYAGQPISAVVFLVPGEPAAVPYDFCVNGFTTGSSADDAPDGPAEIGDQTGTVGDATADGDFRRAKVTVDGEQYIIQNNNWGNPEGTDLILNYFNNGFTVASGNGSSPGSGIPASFPSIYIGANGNTANGVYSTSGTDNLPRQISQIASAQSSFAWSGSTGSFNATYDIWFANSPPSAAYNDGIDGFVMIWVRDPPDAQPIGSQQGTANIAGVDWQVWVGPRGDGPEGYNDAPVVSFVSSSAIGSATYDLKEFFTAAGSHGISSSMYLTDVFFGFEIWQGGGGGNLAVDSFTVKVE